MRLLASLLFAWFLSSFANVSGQENGPVPVTEFTIISLTDPAGEWEVVRKQFEEYEGFEQYRGYEEYEVVKTDASERGDWRRLKVKFEEYGEYEEYEWVDTELLWPTPLDRLTFHFPERYLSEEREETIRLMIDIDSVGNVRSVKEKFGGGSPDFVKSAIAGLEGARFAPMVRNGKTAGVWASVEVQFRVEGGLEFGLATVAIPDIDVGDVPYSPYRQKNLESYPGFIPGALFPILDTDQLALAIERNYPPLAREQGIESELVVQIALDREGNVVKSKVDRSTWHEPPLQDQFAQAALKVVQEMTFSAATLRGEPITFTLLFRIRFAASED